MTFKDQLQRTLIIPKTPKRIVSLVPSLTELLIDLGLEKQLIGITRFCVHPKHIKKEKTIIGGTKKVNLEKIKALKPDFILTNKEENSQEIVTQVSEIAPTFVSDLISILGIVLNCKEKAQEINNKISYKKTEFTKLIKDKPTKKVAYFIWQNPFMVAGNNTFINELLKINNFKNIFDDLDRYPEISLENLPDLDYIFLSSEPYPFQEKHKEFFTKYTKAKVILVDGEYFSWYGSRLIKAFDYFSNLQAKLDTL